MSQQIIYASRKFSDQTAHAVRCDKLLYVVGVSTGWAVDQRRPLRSREICRRVGVWTCCGAGGGGGEGQGVTEVEGAVCRRG